MNLVKRLSKIVGKKLDRESLITMIDLHDAEVDAHCKKYHEQEIAETCAQIAARCRGNGKKIAAAIRQQFNLQAAHGH